MNKVLMLNAVPQTDRRGFGHVLRLAAPLLDRRWLPLVIIAFGILLRVADYLVNRSLWFDEAMLSLNILNRSFAGLAQPLDDNQTAPLGVLWSIKLFTLLFGEGEFALRLFALIAGILSLFLFYRVAQVYNRPTALLIGMLLVATNTSLIYYSAEVKQYSSDAAIALGLYLVGAYALDNPRDMQRIVVLQIAGLLAVWFSYPALFVLGGVGVALLLDSLLRRDWHALAKLMLALVTWGVSFIITYFVTLRHSADSQYLIEFWVRKFMPLPPDSWADVRWFLDNFLEIFNNEWGVLLTDVAALLAVLGCVSLFQRSRIRLLMLTLPVLLTLGASAVQRYPFGDRLILFMAPLLLLLIAEGAAFILDRTARHMPAVGALALAIVLVNPFMNVFKPAPLRQDIKPLMAYVQEHRQPDDVIYVYYFTKYAFTYYQDRYGFTPQDWIAGRSWINNRWRDARGVEIINYNDDLDQLRGHDRLWIFFSNSTIDERTYMTYLRSIGTLLDEQRSGTALAALFDLNRSNDGATQP